MEALYHETDRLVQETQAYFQNLEKYPPNIEEVEAEIQKKINAISANCDRLDIMAFKAPVAQRPIIKMRCDQLKYDNKHLQAALTNFQGRRQRREMEKNEREQLLSRRFTAGHEDVMVDFSAKENASLHNSHRGVDEMLSTGSNILDSLRNQRETLKGAHRKIIDLANTLGLSNATISLIERRAAQDKYILIGGLLVTLSVIGLVIMYLT